MKKHLLCIALFCIQKVYSQTYHQYNVGALTSNTDANTTIGYGTYDLTIGNGSNNVNYPVGVYPYGNLINFSSANFGTQFLAANTQSGLYFRTRYGTTYTAWARVYTTGDFSISNYLPLSGGSISGNLAIAGTLTTGSVNLDPNLSTPVSLSSLQNSGRALIGWNRSGGYGETDFISNKGGGSLGGFAFYDYSNGGVATNLMTITAGGNIGIGTTSPQTALSVNGTVTTKKIVVTQTQTGWADYVFDSSYNLMPLKNVSGYIKQFGHLPGMISANEVAINGIDVSQTQADLLKKIEELTLYAIAQENWLAKYEAEDAERNKIINEQALQIKNLQEAMNVLLKRTSKQ